MGLERCIRKTKRKTLKRKDPEGPSERRNATPDLRQNEKERISIKREGGKERRVFQILMPRKSPKQSQASFGPFCSPTISVGLPTEASCLWTGVWRCMIGLGSHDLSSRMSCKGGKKPRGWRAGCNMLNSGKRVNSTTRTMFLAQRLDFEHVFSTIHCQPHRHDQPSQTRGFILPRRTFSREDLWNEFSGRNG